PSWSHHCNFKNLIKIYLISKRRAGIFSSSDSHISLVPFLLSTTFLKKKSKQIIKMNFFVQE
ncbi:hypothetical protein ACQP3C_29030, partial [Escherichia coli]